MCPANRNSFNKYGEVAHNDIAIVAAAETCSNEYREMSRKHNYAANFASQNSTHTHTRHFNVYFNVAYSATAIPVKRTMSTAASTIKRINLKRTNYANISCILV